MTGTDISQFQALPGQGPVIILVNPQMGENIGAAARAMLNCGLVDLRIVNPRDGWPSAPAQAMSAGALDLMPAVPVFATVADAIADLHHVYATTARPRDMVKNVMTARDAGTDMQSRLGTGQRVGILFGAERSGLDNNDVALAGTVITIPLNPGFSSLNLAQAVLLVAYEWSINQNAAPNAALNTGGSPLATQDSIVNFLTRLDDELQDHGFFRAPDMKPTVVRNLHTLFTRIPITDQEVKTLHGVISALTGKRLNKGD